MWRMVGPGSAPGSPTGWEAHRHFLRDLFTVRRPQTAADLTGGPAATLVRELVPSVEFVPSDRGGVDLVLAERTWPEHIGVSSDGLYLVNGWTPAQTCDAPFTVLASGLAVVAPQGDVVWQWLLSGAFADWSAVYRRPEAAADEQARDLREALEAQEARIAMLEQELLEARDRVQQLLPLELSPKAQVMALSRSVPVSVRKRLRRREQTREQPGARAVDLRGLKKVSLGKLLRAELDPGFTGCSVAEFASSGLPRGEPVNAGHEMLLRVDADALPPAVDDPSVTLVAGDQRTTGALPELVALADAKLVSVDVWDTLVLRDRPADCAKLATARRMVLDPRLTGARQVSDPFEAMRLRVGVEARMAAADPAQEYELAHVLRETLRELAEPSEVESAELADRLVEAEIADEIAWSRARPDVDAIADLGNVVVASDFYMRSAQLREVISAVSPGWRDVPTFVSVDEGCSKRLGGGLLSRIRARSGVVPAEHLHIGDNPHSDVAVQVAAGGKAIQVAKPTGFPDPGEFGPADIATCAATLERELRRLAVTDGEYEAFERAGQRTAPLAVVHVARAIEEAYTRGLGRVHYVSREGIFSSAVHEIVEPVLRPPGVRPVEAVHLALSRRATFGASLSAPFRMSLQRMWSMYARQSVRAMLTSIGLDPAEFAPEVEAAGLSMDEVVADARRDGRVERLLADPAVEARIEAHVLSARSLLRRYVLSRTDLDQPFLLADIGWRGTIQDNLVRALGIRESIGVYLGLFPFLNAQPPGASKIGVAFDANTGEDFDFADPPGVLERPWTPDVASTIGFAELDGQVVPRHDKESGHVSPGIAAFQRGSLSAARTVAEWMAGFGFTAATLHEQAGRWARTVWEDPPEGLADIWFASDHDDSFGALNVTSFGKDAPGPQWLQGSLYEHVRRGARSSGWPAGYLAWRPVRSLIELAGR
ncbi:MAG TPA: hypothetical protein PLT68_00135 [Actinomycetota bacterium]|nr:hypothetical protein [Actinomycetota bacterium]